MNKDSSGFILQIKDLNVSLGGQKIIEGVSLNLKDKENLMIVGPNGAGKTIMLKALLGLIPYEGEIKWKENIKIGYVPQRLSMPKEIPLSVEEFFKFKSASMEKIRESLESVGLNDFCILKMELGMISAGQFQRVMIAWSLIDKPDALLFDEPTAGIDIGGEETIYNLLKKIEKSINITIILVTHDLNIVYRLADNVLCLNKKALCYGNPKEALSPENIDKLYKGEIKFYDHTHD